jgi:hypothetical protein
LEITINEKQSINPKGLHTKFHSRKLEILELQDALQTQQNWEAATRLVVVVANHDLTSDDWVPRQ